MSQLDSIKALLSQADKDVLLQVRDQVNKQLEGEDYSGHSETPDSAKPSDEPIGKALDDQNDHDTEQTTNNETNDGETAEDVSDVDTGGGDGTEDGTMPSVAMDDSSEPTKPGDHTVPRQDQEDSDRKG